MAIISEVMDFRPNGRHLQVTITFNDAARTVVDDEVNDDACLLVSIVLACIAGPVTVSARRGNGQVHRSATLQTSQSETITAGGPVRRIRDLSNYQVT